MTVNGITFFADSMLNSGAGTNENASMLKEVRRERRCYDTFAPYIQAQQHK
jgi:hypothetical protein